MSVVHGEAVDFRRIARLAAFGLFLKGPLLAYFYHHIEVPIYISNTKIRHQTCVLCSFKCILMVTGIAAFT